MHVERPVESYLADLVSSHNLAPLRLCGRISLSDWQCEEKPAPFADFAFDPNFPSMHLDELFRQRKAQAGALRFSRLTRCLLKFEEDPFMIFCRDPRPCVTNLHTHRSVLSVRPHPDSSSLWRELDGVSDQVQKHLLDSSSVHGKRLRQSTALDM